MNTLMQRSNYLHIYVCMYVCMHACMYVCMYVRMYLCMHVCMYVCMYNVCIVEHMCIRYVYLYVRVHVYMQMCVAVHVMYACICAIMSCILGTHVKCTCMHICKCLHLYVLAIHAEETRTPTACIS